MAEEINDFDLDRSSDNTTDNELSEIQSFYNGMTVFLTGSTGFIGRLILEKLLRTCSGMKKIYILIREKKGKTTEGRFEELFNDSLFESIKKKQPKLLEKVSAIIGDCSLPNLGLTKNDQDIIQNEVNIVIHSAATVNFNEHLRLAANINIFSLRDLLILSQGIQNLKSFVHVSTAYSNCTSERKVLDEVFYKPPVSSDELLYLTKNYDDDYIAKETPRILKSWPNTYTMTKSVAESELLIYGKGLPIGILRPSMIVSTDHDPVSGWINNIYGPVGVTAGVGVGLTRCMCADINLNADILPGDFVSNAIIACAWDIYNRWKEHSKSIKPDEVKSGFSEESKIYTPPIYNFVSSNRNPISWGQFISVNMVQYMHYPSVDAMWYPTLWICNSTTKYKIVRIFLHTIPGLMVDYLTKLLNMKPVKMTKKYKKLHQFIDLISYFALQTWSFRENNTISLLSKLSEQDQSLFQFDISKLNWNDYFKKYIKGIRVYILKDPLETLPQGLKHLKRLYIKHYTLLAVLVAVILFFLYQIVLLFL